MLVVSTLREKGKKWYPLINRSEAILINLLFGYHQGLDVQWIDYRLFFTLNLSFPSKVSFELKIKVRFFLKELAVDIFNIA